MPLPPAHFPFVVPERYHTLPDLKRLEGRHFLLDAQFGAYLRRKLELLPMQPTGGFVASSDPEGLHTALWAVLEHLALEWPEFVALDGSSVTHALLGLRLGRDGGLEQIAETPLGEQVFAVLHALDSLERGAGFLGLAVQEDLALLHGDHTEWLHVSFPSGWRPAQKIGLGFADLHRPVAHSSTLVRAAPNVVRAMLERGPFQRHVWLLSPHADLSGHPDLHPRDPLEGLSSAALAGRTALRFERQTTLGLPARGRALFTIRISVQPLEDLAADLAKRAALARVLRSMDAEALEYRGYGPYRERWLAWLEGHEG